MADETGNNGRSGKGTDIVTRPADIVLNGVRWQYDDEDYWVVRVGELPCKVVHMDAALDEIARLRDTTERLERQLMRVLEQRDRYMTWFSQQQLATQREQEARRG